MVESVDCDDELISRFSWEIISSIYLDSKVRTSVYYSYSSRVDLIHGCGDPVL